MTKSKVKILGDIAFYLFLSLLVFIVLCQVGVFPYRLVYVKSGSMAPVINTGDLAIVKIDSEFTPKVGDIIYFPDQGTDTIHRVVDINGNEIETKGDFNNAPDTAKVHKAKGRFLFSIPLLGYVVVFVQREIFWIITLFLVLILLEVLHDNKMFPFNQKEKGG